MKPPPQPSLLSLLSPSERQRLPILASSLAIALYFLYDLLPHEPSSLAIALPLLFFLLCAWILRPLARAARERALIQHGRRLQGRVIEQRFSHEQPRTAQNLNPRRVGVGLNSQLIARVGYLDADSKLHTRDLPVQRHASPDLSLEAPITLYVDPRDPDLFTAPSLLAFPDTPDAPAADARPERLPARTPPHADSDASWQTSLTDPGDALGWGWWDLLYWRKRQQLPAWKLSLQGAHLTLQRDQNTTTLDLERPFTVQLSCWIDAPGTVTLHIHLRQRTDSPDAPRLAFSVRLPQDRVDQTVPLQQQHLPTLDPERFDDLWSHLASHAHLHGDTLRGVQLLKAPALDTAPVEHQHEQLHVGRSAR